VRTVVDAYLIDVAEAGSGLAPVSYRERLRALGPTNELTHGKQAIGGAAIAALSAAAGAARSTGRLDLIRRK
jgi:sulfite reductase (NADPH) hemoprotein beta-component